MISYNTNSMSLVNSELTFLLLTTPTTILLEFLNLVT